MRRRLLLILTLLGIYSAAQANILELGTGSTSSSEHLPTNTYYRYAFSQQLYTAYEIGRSGTITSLAFYNNSNYEDYRDVKIYLTATTSKKLYSQASTYSSDDLVFNGRVTFKSNVWTTITLDTPFTYSGSDNLLVTFEDWTYGYREQLSFLTYATEQTQADYDHSDQYKPDLIGEGQLYTAQSKNCIQIGFKEWQVGYDSAGFGYYDLPLDIMNFTITEQIYTRDEIGQEGNITSISFFHPDDGYISPRNIDIYLVSTDKESFDSETDWIQNVSAKDLVFSGDVTFIKKDWTDIPLNRSFSYDGTSNLALIVRNNTGYAGEWGLFPFLANSTQKKQAIIHSVYTSTRGAYFPYSPADLEGVKGNTDQVKNVVRFSQKSGEMRPTGLYAEEKTFTSAKIAWNSAPLEQGWLLQYKKSDEEEWGETITIPKNVTSYTLSDLEPYKIYKARVAMKYGMGTRMRATGYTELTFSTTLNIFNIAVSDITAGSAQLNWTGEGTKWEVQWSKTTGATVADISFATEKSFLLTDLKPETNYTVYIRPVDDEGHGGSQSKLSFTTAEIGPRPTHVEAISTTPSSIVLKWTENGDAKQWQVCVDDDEAKPRTAITNKAFVLADLEPDHEYSLKVRSVINAEEGQYTHWSNSISVTTSGDSNAAPEDTEVTPRKNSAAIRWTGVGESYTVHYALQKDGIDAAWAEAETTLKEVVLTDLEAASTYEFYVTSHKHGMTDHSTQHLTFTTLDKAVVPCDVKVTPTNNSATITWTGESETYRLLYRSYAYVLHEKVYGDIVIVETSEPRVVLTGLTPATSYEFGISGFSNGELDAQGSVSERFTTLADEPVDIVLSNKNTTFSNATIIKNNDGKLANVTIKELNLTKDGRWQTISLPFDVDLNAEDQPLAGADARTMETAFYVEDTRSIVVNMLNPVSELKAGVPYIIRWHEGETIEEAVFKNVVVSNSINDVVVGHVISFDVIQYNFGVASYWPTLYGVTGTTTLESFSWKARPAFDCHFQVLDPLQDEVDTIVINTGEDSDLITGIAHTPALSEGKEAIYNVVGQRLSKKQKGINIVNGKKISVK